jgi:hypothetical protein
MVVAGSGYRSFGSMVDVNAVNLGATGDVRYGYGQSTN